MTDTPRKRGRPRKAPVFAPPGSAKISFPFERLPNGQLTREDMAAVVARIRHRASHKPSAIPVPVTHLPQKAGERIPPPEAAGPSEDLANWLNAAADALEENDGGRATFYLLQAMRCREVELANELVEFAEHGYDKLSDDKKKGRRTNW